MLNALRDWLADILRTESRLCRDFVQARAEGIKLERDAYWAGYEAGRIKGLVDGREEAQKECMRHLSGGHN